jgi:hypothetical protein
VVLEDVGGDNDREEEFVEGLRCGVWNEELDRFMLWNWPVSPPLELPLGVDFELEVAGEGEAGAVEGGPIWKGGGLLRLMVIDRWCSVRCWS